MAKAYRDAPLIGADDRVGLPIRNARTERMAQILGEMVALFDGEFIIRVAMEIGLDECVGHTVSGEGLEFDLTPLQLTALASALAACAEFRDDPLAARSKRRGR